MRLAAIKTKYKIISSADDTDSRRFLLLLHAGSKLHSSDWVFLCTLYFVFFIVFLDLLLCVFSNSASGLQIIKLSWVEVDHSAVAASNCYCFAARGNMRLPVKGVLWWSATMRQKLSSVSTGGLWTPGECVARWTGKSRRLLQRGWNWDDPVRHDRRRLRTFQEQRGRSRTRGE